MTTTSNIDQIRVIDAQLNAALVLPDGPEADVAIETASVMLIAALLRQSVPQIRYLHLDWSCQGPHHEADDFTDAAGTSFGDVVDAASCVWTLATNLRGAIADQFEAINADGGVYRVDLNVF